MRLEVLLGQPGLERQIEMLFELTRSSISKAFADLVDQANSVPSAIVTGWGMGAGTSDGNNLVDVLSENMACFNELNQGTARFGQQVELGSLSQDILNDVHRDFETFLNARKEGSDHLVRTTDPVPLIDALNNVNDTVHRLEHHLNNASGGDSTDAFFGSYFTSSFLDATSREMFNVPLRRRDYWRFTMAVNFGDVYVDYGTTGKNLLHIKWNDDLESVRTPGGVSPQQIIHAGIMTIFDSHDKKHWTEFIRFADWFRRNDVSDYGFRLLDPRNSLGMLKLGSISPSQSNDHLYDASSRQWDRRAFVDLYAPYPEVRTMKVVR